MEHPKSYLVPAERAEELRKYFEVIFIECHVEASWLEDSRQDDPGDWESEGEAIDTCLKKADNAKEFAELFGGIDEEYCWKQIRDRTW